MHLFGVLGTIVFAIGFLGAFYLGIEKLLQLSRGIQVRLITDNPVFYIALTCMMIGSQLFLAGFVAELVARNSPGRNKYEVECKIGLE